MIRTFARKGVRFVAETRQERAPILGGLERGGVADVSPATDAVLTLPDKPSIAVLPFANLSDDPEQEYFADGMVEEIITALSRIRWLFVIARNSTFTYKGQAVDIRQVGRELGVRYVLEGSVRKAGGRVRITAQLIEAETGAHVWSERFDRDLSDVFAVQDEITESIVANIEPRLYTAENFRAQRKPPEALDAWGLVMRALSLFWRVTRADNLAARALLEKAIAIDGDYGQAYGVLAESYVHSAHFGWADHGAVMKAAEGAALAAIQADGEDPWAHNALGNVYLFARRYDDSLAEFELALRLNPNFVHPQAYYGLSLAYSGRWQEGDEAVTRALRLSPRDPYSPVYAGILAYNRFLGGRYDNAIALSRESLRQRSDFVGAHRVLTAALGFVGERAATAEALRDCRRAQPNISIAWLIDHMPMRNPADLDHYLEGFRRAGLS